MLILFLGNVHSLVVLDIFIFVYLNILSHRKLAVEQMYALAMLVQFCPTFQWTFKKSFVSLSKKNILQEKQRIFMFHSDTLVLKSKYFGVMLYGLHYSRNGMVINICIYSRPLCTICE